MECNKDEAVRAREIAEKKLAMQDYEGAKKFAYKALQLFPGVESIPQILAVVDVHTAAQVKLNGTEMDWYGILQVDAVVAVTDEGLIKRQFRKLALLLHPDKNKFPGAEAAFKLIGEASQVLMDQSKRALHDIRRRPPAPPSNRNANGVGRPRMPSRNKSNGNTNSNTNNNNNQYFQVPTEPPLHEAAFWTMCPSCLMRYQYLRTFENQNLLCPSCRMPFLAKDMNARVSAGPTPNFAWSHYPGPQFHHHPPPPDSKNFSSVPQTGFASTTNGFVGGTHPGMFHEGAQDIPTKRSRKEEEQKERELKRQEREAQKKAKEEEHKEKERRKQEREQQKKERADEKSREAFEKLLQKKREQVEKAAAKERKRQLKKHGESDLSDNTDDDSDEEMLEDADLSAQGSDSNCRRSFRARRNVSYKLVDSDEELKDFASKKAKTDSVSGTTVGGDKTKPSRLPKMDPGKQSLLNLAKDILQKGLKSASIATKVEAKEVVVNQRDRQSSTKKDATPEKSVVQETYTVPDPDFHDFDSTREAKDILAGTVWALYDDEDGMPRYYVKVKEVDYDPFEVTVTWLHSRTSSTELKQLLDLGYVYACGEFWPSKTQTIDSVNSFSHAVKWEKGLKGKIRIYPRAGEIWGLYSNWKPGKELMELEEGDFHKYDMVEVVSDYEEEMGIRVKSLGKVKGFTSLFEHLGEFEWTIKPAELTRFSHLVPAYRMKGDEGPGVPEGCWELDTAAISTESIQPESEALL